MFWEDLNDNGYYEANEYSDQTHSFDYGDFYVDESGNIWQGENPITVWNATILSNGNIHYSSSNITQYQINGIGSIGKIVCQKDKDRLVLETAACRDIDGGQVYVVNNFWKGGNRNATFVSNLKIPVTDPDNSEIASWTAAGNYGFEVGWATRAKVWITDLSNGNLVGTMEPSAACGTVNRTGWVDIAAGIQAYQRTNGEYIIFVEDDWLSRVILYRWCPTGNCANATSITNNHLLQNSFNISSNPPNDHVTVEGMKINSQIELFDVLGKKVLTQLVNEGNTKIDLSGFNQGIYFFRIMSEDNLLQTGRVSVHGHLSRSCVTTR
jgi:hypothetical protein